MTLLISIFVSNRDIAGEAGSSSKSNFPYCHSHPVCFRFKGSDVVDEVCIGNFLIIMNLMPGYEEDGIGTANTLGWDSYFANILGAST